ncbi:MAG TPA: CPBP family glutamic-type intramembrane protease [Daejeonella sp.]|nr:CPBP family glutamic-type intramembrane protease [Daejeonella sp.]
MSNLLLGNSDSGPDMKNWFIVIIVAPIVETFINQFGVFRIFNRIKITQGKQGWIILISASIFGLTHTYSLSYMIFGFSMGIVLAYIYYLFHHTPLKAFWTTALIHSFRNLTAAVLLALFA